MTMTIRAAVLSDWPSITTLASRLADFDLPPRRTPGEIARADHPIMRAQLEAPRDDVLFLMAESGDQPLGMVFANTRQDYFTQASIAYIEVLAVAAEAAGHGVGKALMASVERWARSRRLARVDLMVYSVNHRARGFYEHLGYENEFSRYVKPL